MKGGNSILLFCLLLLLSLVEARNIITKTAAARVPAAAQAFPATRTAQKCLAGAQSSENCSVNPIVAFSSSLGSSSSLPDRCGFAVWQSMAAQYTLLQLAVEFRCACIP
jgi:hypothetical protein